MNNFSSDLKLKRIFIGRERERKAFDRILQDWQTLVSHRQPELPVPTMEASPQQRLEGLLILLYGHGGYGKSTLLTHYHKMAVEKAQLPQRTRHLIVSKVVDWEFAIGDFRGLFHSSAQQEPDAALYFEMLSSRIAHALDKQPAEFRRYQQATRDMEETRKQVQQALDELKSSKGFEALGSISGENAMQLIRLVVPRVGQMLDITGFDEQIKAIAGVAVQIGTEQIKHAYERLHVRLGARLDASLNPALRLGLALGRDLREFARRGPILFFFDTYEVISEGDRLLRIVMAGAGRRAGWVLAGRDDLWADSLRAIGVVYGYRAVAPDLALRVDFSERGVGPFDIHEIQLYFAELCELACDEGKPLPTITDAEAEAISTATLGVPLAVQIAAGIYWETARVSAIIEGTEGSRNRELVDKMVQRYLLHVGTDLDERARLYGLALARRADQPDASVAALGLTDAQAASGDSTRELRRLHRRYSFIFTEKAQPALHQEVRHFLRLALREGEGRSPEIQAVILRLKTAHEVALAKCEQDGQYPSFKDRIQNEEWVGAYLDLTEQHFWLNPNDGVRYALPLMIAAATYNERKVASETAEIGKFFEGRLPQPSRDWWQWATESFAEAPAIPPIVPLHHLAGLIESGRLTFLFPLPGGRNELRALICWNLGKAWQGRDDARSLQSFEEALTLLPDDEDLKKAAAEAYWRVAYKFQRQAFALQDMAQKQECYSRLIELFNRAIELDPDTAYNYYNRGWAYAELGMIDEAIADYEAAIERNPGYVVAHFALGVAYHNQSRYEQAIDEYTEAIKLDPQPTYYFNRGLAYKMTGNGPLADSDFAKARQLDPARFSSKF